MARYLCVLIVWGVLSSHLCRDAFAQKVHALVVGDISPSAGWGKYTANVAMDLTSLYAILHENLPEANIDYRNIQIEEDRDSHPNTLLNAVEEMSPGPNDTVFFYFTGHGSADDQGHYLALANGRVYRQQLIDRLQQKKARLVVLITDCCNSRSDGYLFLVAAPFVEPPKSVTPLFASLLLEPKGIVDINSCSPGESAFFAPIKDQGSDPPGSIFSLELAAWMREHKQRKSTWDQLVHQVSLRVHASFKAYYPNGASVAKGQLTQTQQTVYPIDYPGMPVRQGPRTGLVVRDFPGQGVVIISVAEDSPATQVYDAKRKKYLALQPQQSIIAANGLPIAKVSDLYETIRSAPQIIRIGIRDALTGEHEYLMRMRY